MLGWKPYICPRKGRHRNYLGRHQLPLTTPCISIKLIYRPPKDLSFYEKLEKLDKQLQHISRRRNNIFIIGDLNSDVSSKPSENGSKLKQILRKHGLSNVIKDYTRVTETSRSTIDLSITSKKCQIKTAGVFDIGIADHRLN